MLTLAPSEGNGNQRGFDSLHLVRFVAAERVLTHDTAVCVAPRLNKGG
jgi:hypothetical protein